MDEGEKKTLTPAFIGGVIEEMQKEFPYLEFVVLVYKADDVAGVLPFWTGTLGRLRSVIREMNALLEMRAHPEHETVQ